MSISMKRFKAHVDDFAKARPKYVTYADVLCRILEQAAQGKGVRNC